jgi:probable HAF family extracellular repeat protein
MQFTGSHSNQGRSRLRVALAVLLCSISISPDITVRRSEAAEFVGPTGFDLQYAIIELPRIPGGESGGAGINNAGDVTGWTETTTVPFQPMIYRNGILTELPLLPGQYFGSGSRINESGEVVGNPDGPKVEGVFWDADGKPKSLGHLGGGITSVQGLNNLGQAVGVSELQSGARHAFLWEDDLMIDLGDLHPTDEASSIAYDVNDHTQVVGYGRNADGLRRAFIWEDGDIRELPGYPLQRTYAYGINDSGYVVGTIGDETADRGYTGIVWKPNGENVLLKKPTGRPRKNEARVINNHNIILGTHYKEHAAKWSPYWPVIWSSFDAEPFLVQSLLPPHSGWIIDRAQDINDHNQITGDGIRSGRINQGYILTPVTYSFDLSAADPGVAGQVNSITASGLTPGTTVYIYASTRGGGTMIPGCTIQENVMQIDTANKLLGIAIADINGEATVSGIVPAGAAGRPLLFQAVVPDSCEISNLVDQMFD